VVLGARKCSGVDHLVEYTNRLYVPLEYGIYYVPKFPMITKSQSLVSMTLSEDGFSI
jgi:hypothetical protein